LGNRTTNSVLMALSVAAVTLGVSCGSSDSSSTPARDGTTMSSRLGVSTTSAPATTHGDLDSEMRDALVEFLDALEEIGVEHEELFDTDVRERLSETIERVFVLQHEPVASRRTWACFRPMRTRLSLQRPLCTCQSQQSAPARSALMRRLVAQQFGIYGARSRSGTSVDEFLGAPE